MTFKDQIIEEIRQPRREISAECGHDLRTFAAYMEKQNALFATQISGWSKMEDERSHTAPVQSRATEASIVAEEPPPRGSREHFRKVLDEVPDRPPVPGDEL